MLVPDDGLHALWQAHRPPVLDANGAWQPPSPPPQPGTVTPQPVTVRREREAAATAAAQVHGCRREFALNSRETESETVMKRFETVMKRFSTQPESQLDSKLGST